MACSSVLQMTMNTSNRELQLNIKFLHEKSYLISTWQLTCHEKIPQKNHHSIFHTYLKTGSRRSWNSLGFRLPWIFTSFTSSLRKKRNEHKIHYNRLIHKTWKVASGLHQLHKKTHKPNIPKNHQNFNHSKNTSKLLVHPPNFASK